METMGKVRGLPVLTFSDVLRFFGKQPKRPNRVLARVYKGFFPKAELRH